jgi:hypothetical protein
MASGHVNRVNRPNTWLHRPTCDVKISLANSEPSTHDPSRQFIAAQKSGHYWGTPDIGRRLAAAASDAIDPNVWSGRALQEVSSIWQMRSCINVSGLSLERVGAPDHHGYQRACELISG